MNYLLTHPLLTPYSERQFRKVSVTVGRGEISHQIV